MADRILEGLINLHSRLVGNGFAQAQKQLRGLDASVQRMNARMQRVSTGFTNMGDGLARSAAVASTISIPAAIGLNQTVTQLGELEKSYANIAAFSGEGAENLKALQEQGRKLARTGAVTAPQIATAQFELTKSGWSADDILAGMPDLVKGSVALDMEISPLADKMTDVMAGFGIALDQMTGTMELFAAAVGSSAMNGNQFFEAMKSAGPAAQIAGVPIEQLTTMIAGFADAGLFGAEAGNSLKSALIKLTAPTPKLRKQLEGIGVNFDQVYQKISRIQSGKIKTALELVGIEGEDKLRSDIRKTLLDDTMSVQQRVDVAVDMAADGRNLSNAMRQQLEDSFTGAIELTDGNIDPLKLIDQIRSKFEETGQVDATIMREIFGLETIAAGQKFLDQLDSLEERERAILKKRAGFLGSVYDANLDTIINAQGRMGNAFKEFFQTLGGQDGESFKSAFNGIADTIFSITDALKANPEAARGALKALTGLTLLAPGLIALSVAASGLGVALKPLAWLSSLTLAPVGMAATKLAAGFGAMAATLPTSTRRAKAFAKSLKGITAASIASKVALLPLRGALIAVGGAMKFLRFGAFGIALGATGVAVAALSERFGVLSSIVGTGLREAAKDGLTALNRLTEGDLSGAWVATKDAFADLSAAANLFGMHFSEAWTNVLDGLEEQFPALKRFREAFGDTLKIVRDAFSGLFESDGEGDFLGWLGDTAKSAGNGFLKIMSDTFGQFNTSFTNWIDGMRSGEQSVFGIFNVLKETVSAAMASIWQTLKESPVGDWLENTFGTERFDNMVDAVERFGQSLSAAWESVFGATDDAGNVTKEPSALGRALQSLSQAAANLALDAAIMALNGLASAINALTAANDRFDQARKEGKGIIGAGWDALGELNEMGWATVILAGIWAINKAFKVVRGTVRLVSNGIGGIRGKINTATNAARSFKSVWSGIGQTIKKALGYADDLSKKQPKAPKAPKAPTLPTPANENTPKSTKTLGKTVKDVASKLKPKDIAKGAGKGGLMAIVTIAGEIAAEIGTKYVGENLQGIDYDQQDPRLDSLFGKFEILGEEVRKGWEWLTGAPNKPDDPQQSPIRDIQKSQEDMAALARPFNVLGDAEKRIAGTTETIGAPATFEERFKVEQPANVIDLQDKLRAQHQLFAPTLVQDNVPDFKVPEPDSDTLAAPLDMSELQELRSTRTAIEQASAEQAGRDQQILAALNRVATASESTAAGISTMGAGITVAVNQAQQNSGSGPARPVAATGMAASVA